MRDSGVGAFMAGEEEDDDDEVAPADDDDDGGGGGDDDDNDEVPRPTGRVGGKPPPLPRTPQSSDMAGRGGVCEPAADSAGSARAQPRCRRGSGRRDRTRHRHALLPAAAATAAPSMSR